tara:strand:- start:787 stop:1797 length:1011 start_codon:yes stop_codon:yes gene_type:complete
MSEIKIIEYSSCWEKKHADFAKKFWPNKKRRYISEYIYWKFRGDVNTNLSSFILAVENDIVIGQFGFIPCSIKIKGVTYLAQWICDLMVDEKYRGKGVAKKLYEYSERNGRLSLGSNPSPPCQKSLIRNGYQLMYGPEKWIFPISIGGTLMLKAQYFKFFKWIKNPLLYYINHKYKNYLTNFTVCNKVEIKKKYLLSRKSCQSPYVIYDELFLNWRMDKFKDYYPGIKMFKSIYNDSYVCFMKTSNSVFITDYNYKSISDLATIVLLVSRYCLSKNLYFIKILSNSNKDNEMFRKLSLIKMRTSTVIVAKKNSYNSEGLSLGDKFFYTLMDSDSNI